MNIAKAIRAAAERLASSSDTARLDAELLMAHALDVSRSDILLRHMDRPAPADFDALVDRRASHEPVAYITGQTEFYGLELDVAPGVLIPRGDSETLIEAAKDVFAARKPPESILDLGTGSGALLLAAMSIFPSATGHATDASEAVVPILLRNVQLHGDGRSIAFEIADWRAEGWAKGFGQFDLILCNPPYVEQEAELDPDVREFEPASALFAGQDGLDDYRILIPQIRSLMNEGAIAIFEIGATQADAVCELAKAARFTVEIRRDLANRPRAVVLRQ